jgi:hypothetical protein
VPSHRRGSSRRDRRDSPRASHQRTRARASRFIESVGRTDIARAAMMDSVSHCVHIMASKAALKEPRARPPSP